MFCLRAPTLEGDGAVFAIAAQQKPLLSSYRAAATSLQGITKFSFLHRVIGDEQKL
jgi:hypothetical protein